MTPQEQVKMLREAVQQSLACVQVGANHDSERAAVFRLLSEALAATAPPKPYDMVDRNIRHRERDGVFRHVCAFFQDATRAEVDACLSALHSLSENGGKS